MINFEKLQERLNERLTSAKDNSKAGRRARRARRHMVLGVLLSSIVAAMAACTVHNVVASNRPSPATPGDMITATQAPVELGSCLMEDRPAPMSCDGLLPRCATEDGGLPGDAACLWHRRPEGDLWFVPGGNR